MNFIMLKVKAHVMCFAVCALSWEFVNSPSCRTKSTCLTPVSSWHERDEISVY